MDAEERKRYEDQSHQLRIQLKQWEGKWAAAHSGDKPSREDIKNNPDIASKYKKYHKIRYILDAKAPAPKSFCERRLIEQVPIIHHTKSDQEGKGKRKSEASVAHLATPAKRSRFTQTPSQGRTAQLSTTPTVSRKLFSPAASTSIGPTPQKDGKILGLFDLLEEEVRDVPVTTALKAVAKEESLETPNKNVYDLEEDDEKLGKTPMSSGRRNYLAMFITPVKPRGCKGTLETAQQYDDPLDDIAKMFQTPEFLKRDQPLPIDVEYKSPDPIRLPRKPLGKTLSSIIADLRKMEDERMDEEMDLTREMEAQCVGALSESSLPKAATKQINKDSQEKTESATPQEFKNAAKSTETSKPSTSSGADILTEILAKDSQVLLGGFDDEAAYDSPVEEQLDRGKPLRVYKKKAPKRTTRKTNMRPVRSKRPNNLTESSGDDSDEHQGKHEVVPDTQYDATAAKENIDPADGDDIVRPGGGFKDKDNTAPRAHEGAKKKRGRGRPNRSKTTKDTEGTATTEKNDDKKDESKGKRTARKVNQLAHANFRALKLKNRRSKTGPGFPRRWRRRR